MGPGPALAVIAAATLTFAQGPTEKTRSLLMSSDPPNAAFYAAGEPTANADVQPMQKPADDLVHEAAVPFRPHEVQQRARKLYVPISIENTLGIHKRGGPQAFPKRRGCRLVFTPKNVMYMKSCLFRGHEQPL